MPGGVPVATVALDGAKNAGLLALQILSTNNENLIDKILDYKSKLKNEVMKKVQKGLE